jgi:hypothetical protein
LDRYVQKWEPAEEVLAAIRDGLEATGQFNLLLEEVSIRLPRPVGG